MDIFASLNSVLLRRRFAALCSEFDLSESRKTEEIIPDSPRLLLIFSSSIKCLLFRPLAMNCAPSLDMARSNLLPRLSMNVSPSRSTTHARPLRRRFAVSQFPFTSVTWGPKKAALQNPSYFRGGFGDDDPQHVSLSRVGVARNYLRMSDAGELAVSARRCRSDSLLRRGFLFGSLGASLSHMDLAALAFKENLIHLRSH